MHHYLLFSNNCANNSYLIENLKCRQFDELIISWNATRPKKGHFSIYVSVKTGKWSPWLLYVTWGANFQKSHLPSQDCIQIKNGELGSGYRLKIVAENGAKILQMRSIHVCLSKLNSLKKQTVPLKGHSTLLEMRGLSQMALKSDNKKRICSPVSTTSVIHFLTKNTNLNPLDFAKGCWDFTYDIYGNWVFNTAEANSRMSSHFCWVERLENFQPIIDALKKGLPSIISVKGPLPKSALPYQEGHLLAIIGFDTSSEEVVCMDPAFESNDKTIVKYPLKDLLQAWKRKNCISYLFSHSICH